MNIKLCNQILHLLKRVPGIRASYYHIRKLCDKVGGLRFPNKDVILPCNGLRILVRNPRRDSLIGRAIYLTQSWEAETTQFISSAVKPGMTALDIGADIGYYTLLFAKLVGPEGRVFSFEPIPKARWYLERNIELNGFKNVRTFGFALFDKTGSICLEQPFFKSKLNFSKKVLSENDIMVEMKVFDEWCTREKIGHVDLIKIDVEGAELNILQGMKNTLLSYHPAILVEVHPEWLKEFGTSPENLLDFLFLLNYKVQPVDREKVDFSGGTIHLFFPSDKINLFP